MRRVVSLWLPDWPITVRSWTPHAVPPPEARQPFALVERGARGVTLHALNAAARAVGLSVGQGHADALAAVPTLSSAPADPARDAEALRRLALWAERYSPTVAVDREAAGFEGLLLDMTGGLSLFGGAERLLADLRARLARFGVPARAALAATPGAAWALARYGGRAAVVSEDARADLAALPTVALRLSPEAVAALRRLGLKRVDDLYRLPRAALARRFRDTGGLDLVRRLDQALGAVEEPLVPVRPVPRYRAQRVFAEPMAQVDGAAYWAPVLADELCERLAADGQGARRLRLEAFRMDGQVTAVEVALSAPSARPVHLVRLLQDRGFEHLDLGFGADALALSAPLVEPVVERQGDVERPAHLEGDFPALVDRLRARLGERAVLAPAFEESRMPERAERWRPATGALQPPPPDRGRVRPILVFDPPETVEATAELPDGAPLQFTWRRVVRKVARAQGPERVSGEWWREAGEGERDYYKVEDEAGRRYWLYRERRYGDAPAPVWRLQGLFA